MMDRITIKIVKWAVILAALVACFMWIKYKFEHADGYIMRQCYKNLIPQDARDVRVGGVSGFGSSSLYICCSVSKEAVEEFAEDYNYKFYWQRLPDVRFDSRDPVLSTMPKICEGELVRDGVVLQELGFLHCEYEEDGISFEWLYDISTGVLYVSRLE